MFRVGQKVVCVHAGDSIHIGGNMWLPGEEIHEGAVYTIHSTFIERGTQSVMVRLNEVKRTRECFLVWGHDGYGAYRFRPIVERKTDISIFKRMLTPQGVDA